MRSSHNHHACYSAVIVCCPCVSMAPALRPSLVQKSLEGTLVMSAVVLKSGISGLSFDFSFLSPLLFSLPSPVAHFVSFLLMVRSPAYFKKINILVLYFVMREAFFPRPMFSSQGVLGCGWCVQLAAIVPMKFSPMH